MKNAIVFMCVGIVVHIVGLFIFGNIAGAEYGDVAFIAVFSIIPYAKLNIVFAMMNGWAVRKLQGKFLVGGLPVWVWVSICFLLFCSLAIFKLAPGLEEPTTVVKAQMLGGGFVFAILWSLMGWFLFWKEQNRFLSEYDAREHFKNQGLTTVEVQNNINQLRLRGMLSID